MIRHTSGLFIAALFALLASLCAPALSAATVYNVYEYFEGLPADYIPPGGQGYNFRETNPNVTVSPPTFSLGATDIIYNGTTYTCVGWKDGFGVTPDAGSGDSVTFSINSDVAITWVYKSAHRLTLSVAPPSGETRVWGSNDSGQLGDGSITYGVASPKQSTSWPGVYDWNFLTAGTSKTSAGIESGGRLITWGNNASGQLGNGTTLSTSDAQQVPGSYAAVAAGANSTVAVKVDGTLWSWGGAVNGQLGDGTTANRSVPQRVGTDSNWRSVAAGADFNLALKNDGTLWGWGLNYNGQVGVGSRTNITTPTQIGTDTTWKAVFAGYRHAAAIRNDGTLWVWGSNNYGEVGNNSTSENSLVPVQVGGANFRCRTVALGYGHTLCINEDGTLWSWGNAAGHQLGIGATVDQHVPQRVDSGTDWRSVAAGYLPSLAIRNDGSLWGWGTGTFGISATNLTYTIPTRIGTDNNWLQISAATFDGTTTDRGMGLVAVIDNSLWGTGKNDAGQLGNGTTTDLYNLAHIASGTPNDFTDISGIYAHSAALRADGSLWTWGWNGYGQLGDNTVNIGNTVANKNTPTRIAWDKKFIAVAAGSHSTYAIRTDGSLWSWGANVSGELGNGTVTESHVPAQAGAALDWRSVTAGWNFAMAIKNDGSLWAWGENDYGRLGYAITGGNINQPIPKLVGSSTDKWKLAVGGYSRSAGIKEDGSLWLWGTSAWGQLGDGTTTDAAFPKQIMIGSTWKTVAIGFLHTLAIRDDGTLWAWGYQGNGRLGNGVDLPASILTPKQIGSDKNWRSVGAGDRCSAAIKTDGSLWYWGTGPFGQSANNQSTNYVPTHYGTDNNWLQVAVNIYKDGQTERVMAIRASNRVEPSPHLGTRVLLDNTELVLKAKVIPTNGSDPYFLSNYTGASGNVFPPAGASFQLPITLTRDTSLTWINQKPAAMAGVTVGFIAGVPGAVQADPGFFPAVGSSQLATGAVTLSAPQVVTFINRADPANPNTEIWECYGWTGTGDVPPTGSLSSVAFTLTQASGIVWKYKKRPADGVTFSFSVPAAGVVTNADSLFSLYQQSNTPGGWDQVAFDTKTLSGVFEQNTPIRLTAAAMVTKNSKTYYCTGISINSASYRSPVTTSDNGDRKEFVLTLNNTTNSTAAWSLDVSITYAEAVKVAMGQSVTLPTGCLASTASLKNSVTLVTPGNPADTSESAFYWGTESFYPVRPINLFTVTCDNNEKKNYYSDWGAIDQDAVVVGAPVNLQPATGTSILETIHYSESFPYEEWNLVGTSQFLPLKGGRSLLRFSKTGVPAPFFITMKAVDLSVPAAQPCTIGSAIVPTAGQHTDPEYVAATGAKTGYVFYEKAYYDGTGDSRAYDRATRSGIIIPVNTNISASAGQDLVIAWYGAGSAGTAAEIGWPLQSKIARYACAWPTTPSRIVIAQGSGAALNAQQQSGSIYNQPDRTLAGYNLNEEHAFIQGGRVYALRTDLNKSDTSSAYVLLKYKDSTGNWAMTPYQVLAEDTTYTFNYPAVAGQLIQPPASMSYLPPTTSSRHKASDSAGDPWYYLDHKGGHWARAGNGQTGASQSKLVMQWYYPLQSGFYYPYTDTGGNLVKIGDPVPFQNGGTNHTDPPRDVTYAVSWPTTVPVLTIGETLTTARYGLPAVSAMASVKKIYDAGGIDRSVARLFAPYYERAIAMDIAPTGMNTESSGGKTWFTDLPYGLRSRLAYDPTAKKLIFKGLSIDMGTGEPLLLPNIMSKNDQERIRGLSADSNWTSKVASLYDATSAPLETLTIGTPLALSAGNAKSSGYVVLAENDDASLGSAPVALHIVKVDGGPYQGEIKVIKSDNLFDEKLTLRHSGDFAGNTDNIYFSWYYQPDNSGIPPLLSGNSADTTGWTLFKTGKGLNDITIEGAGLLTLEDNWFKVRYYYGDDPATSIVDPLYPSLVNSQAITPAGTTDVSLITNNWSKWVGAPGGDTAQLAEGWIKRVVNDLNPLDARVSDFRNNVTSTAVSMVSQLGERYSGPVALNGSAENLNNLGLISAYQTVLDRGKSFSIDSATPVSSPASDNSLLNAATRIADFYTLLGNEAYSDAQDPTIGFDSRSGQSGTMASSLFAFQNQADSLLEEELVLLRGRDNSTSSTQATPFYNRFIWNFTNGDGEVAYVQTYNISDRNKDGFINEADAKIMYPQGHGDAWGHYLTAMTTWYGLLRNSNFTWIPKSESVLVGSSPIPVDYLDERKFARVAAYKAHAGEEIVDLTYRKLYVDNPAGQWQGYKDNVLVTQNGASSRRAWGVDDWARRAGQGAYFDWVAGNAMLSAVDSVNTGIQKVDRTTVPELKEVASHFLAIQIKADQADAGYNPLRLARGVVPFDIDPNLLSGTNAQSHFEQIYGRAVKALENARTVYDYATQYTLLLRQNEDTLDVFRQSMATQEQSYINQLVEVFGYPYSGDIGTGKSYPASYDGPDIFHYNYMDVPQLAGLSGAQFSSDSVAYSALFDLSGTAYDNFNLTIDRHAVNVSYPVTPGLPWKFNVPSGWGERRAPGEIQMALTDLIRSNAQYQKGLSTYSGALANVESAVNALEARYNVKRGQIKLVSSTNNKITANDIVMLSMKELQSALSIASSYFSATGDTIIEGLPKEVGLAMDPSFPVRFAVSTTSDIAVGIMDASISALDGVINGFEYSSTIEQRTTDFKLYVDDARDEVQNYVDQIGQAEGNLYSVILDLYDQSGSMQQAVGRYKAALAKGERLLDERETFRKRTAGEIQDYRYQDIGFRTFRNDAIQKYRATFDLAARYSYLAATAYDYETNLLRSDKASGSGFLTELSKQRSPGVITNGVPMVGKAGLADPLARLNQNFDVYKTQLGFNNPQTETNPFSLRSELFRIRPDVSSNANWQNELKRYWVSDLNTYDSFKRYCRPFTDNTTIAQPGLVIPFTTQVRFGKNFFGFPLGSGDSAFDSSRFATRIRSVGLWFKGYDAAGLTNTPRAYLVPVGADVLRSPYGNSFEERSWQIVDQKLPVPFPLSTDEIASASYIPILDSLSGDFGGIRKFSSFRAYNDSGITGTSAELSAQMNTDSSLVGRSVWNTQWLLIIPGGYLLDDPTSGLNNFIKSVTDIRLFFQTYSYSGN